MHDIQMKARKHVGEIFRSKREELHLSLKEVENATSIRMMYLQSIEDGHIDKFLSPVYALGFVRQYATFLGFDGQKIIDENKEAFQMTAPKEDPPYGLGTLDVRGSPQSTKNISNVIWTFVTLAMLAGAYFFAKLLKIF